MIKKDLFLIILCLAIFLTGLFVYNSFEEKGYAVEVTVDGKPYATYWLMQDGEYEIGETNILLIENGTAKMLWANCPDKHCVNHAPVDKTGGNIICLPNRVSVKVTSGGTDAEVG